MASRQFNQFHYSLEKSVVRLFANIPIGATGAVGTLQQFQNQGIYSVVRVSAGKYTVTLGDLPHLAVDKYKRIMILHVTQLLASGLPASRDLALTADSVSTGSFTFQLSTGGTATDPDSGDVLLLEVVLKNGSI